jgi:hypothetical protein
VKKFCRFAGDVLKRTGAMISASTKYSSLTDQHYDQESDLSLALHRKMPEVKKCRDVNLMRVPLFK